MNYVVMARFQQEAMVVFLYWNGPVTSMDQITGMVIYVYFWGTFYLVFEDMVTLNIHRL